MISVRYTYSLFEQQREKLLHALRSAWQRKDPETATHRRQMADVVRGCGE